MRPPRNYNKWDAIIDFAIAQEQKSAIVYEKLAAEVDDDQQIELFNRLSLMERGHLSNLEKFKEGTVKKLGTREVDGISQALFDESNEKEKFKKPADIIHFAIGNEIKSHQLYKTLKKNYLPSEDQALFEKLAGEELNHIDILKRISKNYQSI